MFELPDDEAPEPSRPWISGRGLWLCAWAVGTAVLHFAADPSVLVAVSYAHFAAKDVTTGLWLWRRDPVVRRGRTWLWCYVAYGLLKVSVIALAFLMGVLWFLPRHAGVLVTGWLSLGAWGTSALAIGIGMARCSWLGDRIVLDPAIHRSRMREEFPPTLSGRDRLPLVYLAGGVAMVVLMIPLLVTFAILAASLFGERVLGWTLPAAIVLAAIVVLWWNEWGRERHALNTTSSDCWPEYPREIIPPRYG